MLHYFDAGAVEVGTVEPSTASSLTAVAHSTVLAGTEPRR